MGCCLSTNKGNTVKPLPAKSSTKEKRKIADDLDISLEDLQHIDDHALKTPREAEKSIKTLAEYLTKPAKNDVEIVRAFYVWVTDNISYNTDAFFGGRSAQTTSEEVLKCKTSVCEGYASIFLDLCTVSNIKCKKISGFSKGYGHAIGTSISYKQGTDHAWNVVFIGEKWRFIESTWGAGHVDKNKKFVKQFSNFYFFTNPKHFIADHFPFLDNDEEGSRQWQLLGKPISLATFSKAFKPSKHAREWGIEFPSSQFEVITIEKSYSVIIESNQSPLQNVSCHLWDANGTPCQQSTIIVKENRSNFSITIKPNETGTYFFKVYGTVEDTTTSMPEIVEYQIQCTATADHLQQLYPDFRGFYGPKADFYGRGFDINHIPSPFQTCKNGNMQIYVKTTKNLKVLASLYDENGSEISEFLLLEQSNQGILIRARFMKIGYYRISLFSEFETCDSYSEAFNMLVLNKEPSEMKLPFPNTFSTTTEFQCNLMTPLVKDVLANSSFKFQMSSPIIDQLLINGKIVHGTNNSWSTDIKTGASGIVKISGKAKGDSSYFCLYEFEVKT